MAWRDARPSARLHPRLPLEPAPAVRGRGRLDLQGLIQCRERCEPTAARRPLPPDPEFAGSMTVATCAVFAPLLQSGFSPPPPPQSIEGAVIPFAPHACQASPPSLVSLHHPAKAPHR